MGAACSNSAAVTPGAGYKQSVADLTAKLEHQRTLDPEEWAMVRKLANLTKDAVETRGGGGGGGGTTEGSTPGKVPSKFSLSAGGGGGGSDNRFTGISSDGNEVQMVSVTSVNGLGDSPAGPGRPADGNTLSAPVPENRITRGNKLVKDAWSKAIARKDFAITVYHKLLLKYKAATEALFYGVDIAMQSQRLVEMIDSGVRLLEKPDSLIPVMLQLGSRHVIYGVSDIHFDMFNDVVTLAFQEAIGAEFTDELAREWIRVLSLMKTIMLQGYTTPAGIAMRKRFQERVQRSLNKCWKTVLDADAATNESFVAVFHRFGRQKVGDRRADMFNNILTRREPFMAMFTEAFEKGLEDPQVAQKLKELGGRHVAYGLEEKDYDAYASPFLAAMQQRSSPDTFNPFVKAQLSLFWNTITKMMLLGASESRCAFALRFAPKVAPFAILLTEIEDYGYYAASQAIGLANAVDHHNKIVKDLTSELSGYEAHVTSESAFTIAFKNIQDALLAAMRLQVLLLRHPAQNFSFSANGTKTNIDAPSTSEADPTAEATLWSDETVRVRSVLHWCNDATCTFDASSKSYSYGGSDMNVARSLLQLTSGGQLLCTDATLKHIQHQVKMNAPREDLFEISTAKSAPPPPPAGAAPRATLQDVFRYKNFKEGVVLGGSNSSNTVVSLSAASIQARLFTGRK